MSQFEFRLWSMDDVIAVIDARAELANPRGPYRKRLSQAADVQLAGLGVRAYMFGTPRAAKG